MTNKDKISLQLMINQRKQKQQLRFNNKENL